MASRYALLFSLTLAIAPATSGCIFFGGNGSSAGTGSTTSNNTTDQDIAQYEELQAKLEGGRPLFKTPGPMALAGIGNRLFWLDFTNFDPKLRSYDDTTGTEVGYSFSIGTGNDYN